MAAVWLLYAAILLDFVSFITAQDKPGECKVPKGVGPCVSECSSDGDCTGELKCCFNGCGQTCQTPAIEVRLQGSLFNHAGRVEVRIGGGEWGTVCDDSFDHNAASVVCNMLGQGQNGTVVALGMFSPGIGRIWLDDLDCEETDSSLDECDHAGWGVQDCTHAEDVAVTCQPNPLPARLVGSDVEFEGRLEIYIRDEWGRVLSRYFDNSDANVACYMLGFEKRGLAIGNWYGSGTGKAWLDYVYCSGSEDSLVYCSHADWGSLRYNWYSGDASIFCRPGGNCTEILPGCSKIWYVNVDSVYLRMVNGLLQLDELEAICSNWSLCVSNVEDTGCTFDDLYKLVYYNYSYPWTFRHSYSHFTQTLLPYLCDTMLPVYQSYEECYNTPPLQTFTTDCDNFLNRVRRHPYSLSLNDCGWRLYLARCYARGWLKSCSEEFTVNATRLFLYAVTHVYHQYTTCTYDDSELLDPTVLNQFKEEEYVSCVTKEPLMSVHSYAHSIFDYMLGWFRSDYRHYNMGCSYSSNTVISRCIDWSNFTSCLSTNDVTFDDMHQYLSTYQFSDYYYNGSIASYYFFCTHIEEYQAFEGCCRSGTTCHKIVELKGRSPYHHIYSYCSRAIEHQLCKYSDMTSACNETRAQQYAFYYQTDIDIWRSSSCGINESVIIDTPLPDDDNCSDYRYLKCLVSSALQYRLYTDSYKYFTELLKGAYGYPFGNPCSWLMDAIECIGCKPWQSVFPTRDMYLERYYYDLKHLADYLTPMRLYDLCRADEEEYIEYASCFEEKNIFIEYNFTCRNIAQMKVQLEPGYDYCNLYKYWGQCFYEKVSTLCSVPAADYVMMYLVDGWQPVLYHRYGCEFGCDYSSCISDLPPLAESYCELLSNGQLTFVELMNLCTMTGEAVSCISSTVPSMCPNRLKYLNLLRDMESFFCSATEQQAYLLNQACYIASGAGDDVGEYCDGSGSCGERLQMLLDIFTTVNTHCFAAAAKAVVSYMDHLKTLKGLDTIVESSCPSMLYPGISPPKFTGPHIITKTCDGNEVTDFTFECIVQYKPATDVDVAMFDVVLTFDGVVDESTLQTTTSEEKTVVFSSDDLQGHFGTKVSCAVRSYWQGLPAVKSSFVSGVADYFVGLKCDSENMIDGIIRIKESDAATNITLFPTVPITCPPSEMSVDVDESIGLDISECSVHFTEPLANKTITVAALQSSSSFSRVARIVFSAISSPGSPWHGYVPDHCPVVIEDDHPSKCCFTRYDPRITTFDGQHRLYSIYYSGDFLFWRSTAPGVTAEVHVRFRRCFRADGSCTCAVVVRDDNNILGINACQLGRPPTFVKYLVDPLRPAGDIQISADGLTFVIMMPSGRKVIVRATCRIFYSWRCFLSISLCVHTDDAYNSEGLCGNYNYNYADDFIPKDWDTVDTNYLEPVLFTTSYMLKPWDSLMNAHIYEPECVTPQPLPQAECGGNGTPLPPPAYMGTSTPVRAYITGGTYQCLGRRKRRAASPGGGGGDGGDDEDLLPEGAIDPVEEGDIPGPEGLHPNATWPTPSGITLEMATNSCVTPIRSLSIFSVCDEYTAEKMQPLIEGCTLDIQITEDVDAAAMVIDSLFIDLCIYEIFASDNRSVEEALAAYNVSLYSGAYDGNSSLTELMFSDAMRQILGAVLSQTCPGQPACSGRGTCQDSVCTCNEGFTGADCSVVADSPPIVGLLVSAPTCNMRENKCNSFRVIAENFDMLTPITCKLVSDAGIFYTAATTTSGEVRCPIPVFPPDSNSTLQLYSWTVYLSVDNSTWSNGTQLFVYDALSVTCNETAMTCAPSEEGTCLILGRIYEVNDTRSVSSTCYKCLPENSLSAWSWDIAECGPQIKCRPRPKGKWKKKWGKWKKYWKKAQKGPKLPWCKKNKDSSDDSDKGKGNKDKNKGKGGKSNDGSEKSGDSSDSSQTSDERSNSRERSDEGSNSSDRSDEGSNRRGSDRSRSDSDDSGSDSSS